MKSNEVTSSHLLASEGFGSSNLPYGAARLAKSSQEPELVTRLGQHALFLSGLLQSIGGLSNQAGLAVRDQASLDALLSAGQPIWSEVRQWLQKAVNDHTVTDSVLEAAVALRDVEMVLPFAVADYVDFFASEQHATNMGRLLRPGSEPLKPNWKHLPTSYHGRSGTVVPSGTDIRRPKGLLPSKGDVPTFAPSRRLDIEAEVGFVVGGRRLGGELSLKQAADSHIFGVVLLNDWSARDIQAFEYVPLGPHLAKSFATSISTWVIPWEALHAARVKPPARTVRLADYLDDSGADHYGLDIKIRVLVDGQCVASPPFSSMYWTAPQMLAHITANGASSRPGDLFGSGTVSGPQRHERGSLMELTWDGKHPLIDAHGKPFDFLRDGQRVSLQASAPGLNGEVVHFGEVSATILPAT